MVYFILSLFLAFITVTNWTIFNKCLTILDQINRVRRKQCEIEVDMASQKQILTKIKRMLREKVNVEDEMLNFVRQRAEDEKI